MLGFVLALWVGLLAAGVGSVVIVHSRYRRPRDISSGGLVSGWLHRHPASTATSLTPKPTSRTTTTATPGVSIIRPLKGVDAGLAANLECSFRLDYPNFELIFCLESLLDSALPVVSLLMARFPNVAASVSIGLAEAGPNLKVNNMITGVEAAIHDILWVCDSNVMHSPDTLTRSVPLLSTFRQGLPVRLIHHVPVGVLPASFGSLLEQVFLNTVHAKMYLVINYFHPASCLVGKSNIFYKSDLDYVGGLEYFGQFLAEDNTIGQALYDIGVRHDTALDLAFQTLGATSLSDYFQRRVRWSRVRKYCVTASYLLEPFTESVVLGLVLAALMNWYTFTDRFIMGFLTLHFMSWFLIDATLFAFFHDGQPWLWTLGSPTSSYLSLSQSSFSSESPSTPQSILSSHLSPSTRLAAITPKQWLYFFLAWLIRETTALPLYLYAAGGSVVAWRGRRYALASGGVCTVLDEEGINASNLKGIVQKTGSSMGMVGIGASGSGVSLSKVGPQTADTNIDGQTAESKIGELNKENRNGRIRRSIRKSR